MAIAAFSLAYLGFVVLSLTMSRHHRQVFGRSPSRRVERGCWFAGTLSLVASLLACMVVWPGSVSAVAFAGLLTGAAVLHVLMLTYAARALPLVAAIVFLTNVASMLMLV